MSTDQITITGYVTGLPRSGEARRCRVAIVHDDAEYRVLSRGAGVDLVDEVSAHVEASGTVEESDGVLYMTVRKYRILDEGNHWDDDEA